MPNHSYKPRADSLRRGWTTGACAAAATKAACSALKTGQFPDPVQINLPRGHKPAFSLAFQEISLTKAKCWSSAAIIKDSGDDPDITNGAVITATVAAGEPGSGITLKAGKGVGTVTRHGLPVAIGEPAINPGPRAYILDAVGEIFPYQSDLAITLSISDGHQLATHTLNPRLGIQGGLSILGTTGVLVPFSCSAWIDSIQRGIDVARAADIKHLVANTGRTSEQAVKSIYSLADEALIDMGDFAGGTLKYLRRYPVPYLTISGGMAKITKLAQGFMDLHSRRGQADTQQLAAIAAQLGASTGCQERIAAANTIAEAFSCALAEGLPIGDTVAEAARKRAAEILRSDQIRLEVLIFDRNQELIGRAPF
ncbi:cobalt-precorrin-6 synthase [Halorhodospira halochloris]|uniref:Cobalt-precorrin-5B C(1)-methyltransferase n=1 Tax=Halorhodospira halochloris TaxID=1052 RepID=A0A110B788_HALHR|nr:cobalt-precorrin-5B (C(1))-methyltransferase [Halorhodospira halochloris]MBK1652229.1 cobalt-precorrin-5B (C(1))-methyltransferase [Halorhodospira halochloris]BAU58348.2 cobalt-precorrin-6 synthase [Halorhodospira halochloris]